jgi:hypothetical protein
MGKFWFLTLLIFHAFAWSDEASPFEHAAISVEAGGLMFLGTLGDSIHPALQGTGNLHFSYSEQLQSRLSLTYANLQGWEFGALRYVEAGAGLDWKVPYTGGLEFGAGILLFFVRANPASQAELDTLINTGYQLADNESEFGWHARISYPIVTIFTRCTFFAVGHFSNAWTLPVSSRSLSAGLGSEIALW